ncbi:MAG TPA: DUF2071 domain-containing protein [Iamia sp.]
MIVRPDLVGRIDRRVLLDHVVAPDVAARHLPPGLEVRLLDDRAVVGVCLIRLVDVRPAGLPAGLGRTVEAAAHRISVVGPGTEAGVFVPRRDTSSRTAALVGGRVWPGVHGRARVSGARTPCSLRIDVACRDGAAVSVAVDLDERRGTTLTDPEATSAFHAVERTAWSPGRDGALEVAVLACEGWSARPVGVTAATSTWLDDRRSFPPGTARLAGALLMEDVPMRWSAGRPR